jgi:hypothetical protein
MMILLVQRCGWAIKKKDVDELAIKDGIPQFVGNNLRTLH